MRTDTYCAMALPSIIEAGMVVNGRGKEKRGATRGLCRTRSVETLCRAPKSICLYLRSRREMLCPFESRQKVSNRKREAIVSGGLLAVIEQEQ